MGLFMISMILIPFINPVFAQVKVSAQSVPSVATWTNTDPFGQEAFIENKGQFNGEVMKKVLQSKITERHRFRLQIVREDINDKE